VLFVLFVLFAQFPPLEQTGSEVRIGWVCLQPAVGAQR